MEPYLARSRPSRRRDRHRVRRPGVGTVFLDFDRVVEPIFIKVGRSAEGWYTLAL